jgi:hypothetical protein
MNHQRPRTSPVATPRHREPWPEIAQKEMLAHVSRPHDGLPITSGGLENVLGLQASADWSSRVAEIFDATWRDRLDDLYVMQRYAEAADLLAPHRPGMIERCLERAATSTQPQKTFQERNADGRLLRVVFTHGSEEQASQALSRLAAWANQESTAESATAYALGARDHLAARYPDPAQRAARYDQELQATGPLTLPFTGSQLVFSRLRFEATEQPDGLLWAVVMATGRHPVVRSGSGSAPRVPLTQLAQCTEAVISGRSTDDSLWVRAEHLVRWCGAMARQQPALISSCPPLLAALTMGALTGELPGRRGQCRTQDRHAIAEILGRVAS